MKRIASVGAAAFLIVALAGTTFAAAPVSLGTASNFAVLAATTITNTGATTIKGDVGLHPGTSVTGFSTVTLTGTTHYADAVALQAKNDLITAYNTAAGATPATAVATELGGTTLTAGVYSSATLGLTGTLTLNGAGVFIFQAASTLITAPNSSVALINGASACNVFWQVGSSATLASTSSFKGTILAMTTITMAAGVTLDGRALARNGEVTLISDTIDSSSCATPSPTPTPTASASPTPSPTASASPTPSPTASASPTPSPTPSLSAQPVVTLPPTDTLAATPVTINDPVSAPVFVLLVIGAIAFAGSVRFATLRSRPRH